MKTVNLVIKVQVPDDTDEKLVARAVDNALSDPETPQRPVLAQWKVGKTVITRPRVDRAKGGPRAV